MILGVGAFTIASAAGWANPEAWIFFPLVVRAFGLVGTIVAMFFVTGREDEDPMNMLNRGYWVTTILSAVGMAVTCAVMLQTDGSDAWLYFFGAGVVGLATSVAFVYITQFYTAGSYRPVRELADASRTGAATNIISGTAVGFETTLVTAVSISVAIFASHWLGEQAAIAAGLVGEDVFKFGIFGTAVATMGMLMTTAYILAMDTFGRSRTTPAASPSSVVRLSRFATSQIASTRLETRRRPSRRGMRSPRHRSPRSSSSRPIWTR